MNEESGQESGEALDDAELRLLYSLGTLGHESSPAIPRPEDAELARRLAGRGMLSRSEGSDQRARLFGAYTVTARGFEAFNLWMCRRARRCGGMVPA